MVDGLHGSYDAGVARQHPFILLDVPAGFDRQVLARDFLPGSMPTVAFQVVSGGWDNAPVLRFDELELDAYVT